VPEHHGLVPADATVPDRRDEPGHGLRRVDGVEDDALEATDELDGLRARRVEAGRIYHFKVLRDDGRTVHWYVDDLEILDLRDPAPLTGAGHDHFGFNDWDVRLCFDNLAVSALP